LFIMGRTRAGGKAAIVLALAALTSSTKGQGLIAPSAGPINSSMAGASVAAPVDFGASYWNPAAISGLEQQEFLLGSALKFPSTHLQSRLPAGSVLGQFPPNNRFGTSRSDSGVGTGLATGVAFRMRDDSPVTLGLGLFGLSGGNVNFAGNTGTPILSPRHPNAFFGVGPIYANTALLAITPMASVRLWDGLSVGGGPVITSGTAQFAPAFFAPGPKDGTGLPTFPSATNSRPFWGGGFQLGLLYEVNPRWNVGFSYKSPVWQERWNYNASTPDLAARRIGIQAGLPAIYSWALPIRGYRRH
jgi:long-chain fatty acid transport protein